MNDTTNDARQTPDGETGGADSFSYTYSTKQQREIERIRSKYIPREENKLEQLYRLDRQTDRRGTFAAIVLGTLSTLLLGIGMVLTMVYTRFFALGVAVGLLGIAGIALAYPLYLSITRKERARIAPEILRLTDELMKRNR